VDETQLGLTSKNSAASRNGKPMLGFVVPTVGRWKALEVLLSSLEEAAADGHALCAVVVDQSTSAEPRPNQDSKYPNLQLQFVHDDGRGASRARNVGLAALDPSVTHVVWPNDHTTYPTASIALLGQLAGSADVIVGQLVEDRAARYHVPATREAINLRNVWRAIEPVTAISADLARTAGWSEDLGSGAASPWQSSALADLMLRLPRDCDVVWEPEFVADGPGFVRGATGRELDAKVRAYGRGYGRVLSKWDYPWHRRIGSIVKPLVQPGYRVGPDVLEFRARVAAAVGRAEGVSGRLIPGSPRDLRDPRHLVTH
jgi:hypothetical protein